MTSGKGRRLLVVEDHEDTAEMYRMLLELAGHEVRVARTGEQGLALLRDAPPDVVLIDVGLPDIDGYALARRVRAEPGGDRPHLVALTGHASTDDRDRARQAGFDHYFSKPVDLEALTALLNA
jgi:DNA-binding response OmpR family regulator